MTKSLIVLMMAVTAALAQYKVEPAGPPPSDLAPAIGAEMQKDGAKVVGASGPVVEIWLRSKAPAGANYTDEDISLKSIPQGALVGALRFSKTGQDRRGQNIKPGVYTLRYSQHPVNGDHIGVANQRDFLLLTPAAEDTNAAAAPGFPELVAMAKKASGSQHPAVLSVHSSSESVFPSIKKEGDADWALHAKAGDTPIALVVVGIQEH